MAENKERADTERRTDMKQIRRISDVAGELGETALLRLGKLSITKKKKCKRVDWVSVLCCLKSLGFSRLPDDKQSKTRSSVLCSLFRERAGRTLLQNDTTTSPVMLCFPAQSHWSSLLERCETNPTSNIESFWESNRKKKKVWARLYRHYIVFAFKI